MYKALPSRIHVRDSPVAGQGLFAREYVPSGLILGLSHIIIEDEIYRTPLGGFINHSNDPNCEKWCEQDKHFFIKRYYIKTIRPIEEGEELYLKYTFYQIH